MIVLLWINIKKYLGWRNWAVFYFNSILENIFIFFYIALLKKEWSNADLLNIGAFIIFSIFATSYGYLINDFSDRKLDAQHNKANTFAGDSRLKSVFVILVFLLISLLSSSPFLRQPLFLALMATWFFLATFYSLQPLRFKERGSVGLLIVVLAQRVIPVLLIFLAFKFYSLVDIMVLAIFVFLRGSSSDIYHQITDYANDSDTGTKTFAFRFGLDNMAKLFRIVLSFERFFLFLVLTLILFRLFSIKLGSIPYFIFPLLLYVLMLSWILIKTYPLEKRNPFATEKNIFQMIHLVFPNLFLPLFILLPLIFRNINYLVFLLVFFLIYRLYDREVLKSSVAYKFLAEKLGRSS